MRIKEIKVGRNVYMKKNGIPILVRVLRAYRDAEHSYIDGINEETGEPITRVSCAILRPTGKREDAV